MPITYSNFFAIVIFGTLPSIAWLIFYLRKDIHPEPKQLIIQLFLIGFLLAPFVAFGEIFLQDRIEGISKTDLSFFILFAMAALWEEGAKYLAARAIFHHEKEFDELADAMVYLITVALGFAAAENILITANFLLEHPHDSIISLMILRGVGSTLLHAVSSGIVGYFLARSYFLKEKAMLAKGLLLATAIHMFFNWFISKSSLEQPQFILPVILLLIGGFIAILQDFKKLTLTQNDTK